MTQERLLRIEWCTGSTEKGPVGMPKGMPADASETHFRGELAARVVDGDGVSFSSSAFCIFAGDSRSGAAFRTGKQTPAGAANVVLLDGRGMVGTSGDGTRKQEIGAT